MVHFATKCRKGPFLDLAECADIGVPLCYLSRLEQSNSDGFWICRGHGAFGFLRLPLPILFGFQLSIPSSMSN